MRGVVRRSSVTVGRELELGWLRRAVHETTQGTPACAFIVGEAGVGKTRLLAEVTAEASRAGLVVLAGRAAATGPVASGVLAQALRSGLRVHSVDPEVLEPFAAGLRLLLPEWPVSGDAGGLSDAQLRLLALEGVVRLVSEIAARGAGALLVVDDLHASDPESLEAIRYLAAAAGARVMILGALRSGESTRAEQIVRELAQGGGAEVSDLEPLARREVTELLGALLDATPPPELVEDVVARTDGVPLLVEEVLEAHLRSGSLAVDDAGVAWRGGATSVPRTIADMVEARLDRLAAEQRAFIVAGGVLGSFEPALLGAVAGQPLDAAGEAIAAGLGVGLLETVAGSIEFRHAVIGEAVLATALPHTLQSLHRRAASALADRPADDIRALEQRARHLVPIEEHDEAAGLLDRAAATSLDRHALLSAETLARGALDVARSDEARESASETLARILTAQGRWTDALALDEQAVDTRVRLRRMATCAMEAGRLDLAAALVERAVEHGDRSPSIDVVAGRIALMGGDAESALTSAERALAAATAESDPAAACAALDLKGRALDVAGRRPDAAEAFARQADVAAAAGLSAEQLHALVSLGGFEVLEGRPPERMLEARDLSRAAGALVEQAWAELNLAIALTVQGDPEAGLAVAEPAAQRCRELRLDVLPMLLLAVAGARGYMGGARAEALLVEAETMAPVPEMTVNANGLRGDRAMHAGRYDFAVEHLQASTDALRQLPGGIPVDTPCWLVIALAAVGRQEDAARALEEARAMPNLARWHGRPVVLAAADVPEELARMGVTSREAEVLRLVAEGHSNAAIAERLYLSVRTVETHVSSRSRRCSSTPEASSSRAWPGACIPAPPVADGAGARQVVPRSRSQRSRG
jgi:DNA-binding NarL/FixJ family response regulator